MVRCGCLTWPWGGSNTTVSSLAELRELNSNSGMLGPVPEWPTGTGFGTGTISLGEITVTQIWSLDVVWSSFPGQNNSGAAVYKPLSLPSEFFCLGHHCQINGEPVGWMLAVAETSSFNVQECDSLAHPVRLNDASPLACPIDYTFVWSSNTWSGKQSGPAYFWMPVAPTGYKTLGYVVTTTEAKPNIQEVVCVRSDLTEDGVADAALWSTNSNRSPFRIWTVTPLEVGVTGTGVNVGTFYSDASLGPVDALPVTCLSNVSRNLHAMPTLEQVQWLMKSYGPTVFFHPEEKYLPSSVSWVFSQGALLYKKNSTSSPERISLDGSNLPAGGTNDGEYWIDLPNDGTADEVKKGNLGSAETYVHVKSMFGGTTTEVQCWIYYPFNGASKAKIKLINLSLGKIGEHVSDWEHFTLRIGNFYGELQEIYFGEHSKGQWLKPGDLEFISLNHPVVYSSKNGHSAYAHEGVNLQGDSTLGVGIRNDTARSKFILDVSTAYQIVSMEYLGARGLVESCLEEPPWLQYMRQWGPSIQYDFRTELDKLLSALPSKLRNSLTDLLDKLPGELGGEEGPTGPKEKNFWAGPER